MNKFDLLNNESNSKNLINNKNDNIDTVKKKYNKRYYKNNLEIDTNIVVTSESDYDIISSNEKNKDNIDEETIDKGFKYIYSKKKKRYFKKNNYNKSDSDYSPPNTNDSSNTDDINNDLSLDNKKDNNNIIKRLDILNIDKELNLNEELLNMINKISNNINIGHVNINTINVVTNIVENKNNKDIIEKNEIEGNKWEILLNILYNKLLSIRYNNLIYYNERIYEREKKRKELLELTYQLDNINNVSNGTLYDTVINHFGGYRRPISNLAYKIGENNYNMIREMMFKVEENIYKYDTVITLTSESFMIINFTTDIRLRWNLSDRYLFCFSGYNELMNNIHSFYKDIAEITVSNIENNEDKTLKIYILIKLLE